MLKLTHVGSTVNGDIFVEYHGLPNMTWPIYMITSHQILSL